MQPFDDHQQQLRRNREKSRLMLLKYVGRHFCLADARLEKLESGDMLLCCSGEHENMGMSLIELHGAKHANPDIDLWRCAMRSRDSPCMSRQQSKGQEHRNAVSDEKLSETCEQ